jgi:hypothetical protein
MSNERTAQQAAIVNHDAKRVAFDSEAYRVLAEQGAKHLRTES